MSEREAAHWPSLSTVSAGAGPERRTGHLDEGRPRALHGGHQEAIPPQRAAALAVAARNAPAAPYGGHGDDDGHEDKDEMQEAQARGHRLDHVAVDEQRDGAGQPLQTVQVRRKHFSNLCARRLEHELLARVAVIVVLLAQAHEGGRAQGAEQHGGRGRRRRSREAPGALPRLETVARSPEEVPPGLPDDVWPQAVRALAQARAPKQQRRPHPGDTAEAEGDKGSEDSMGLRTSQHTAMLGVERPYLERRRRWRAHGVTKLPQSPSVRRDVICAHAGCANAAQEKSSGIDGM